MRRDIWFQAVSLGAAGAYVGVVVAAKQRWLAPVKEWPSARGEAVTLELPGASDWGLAAGAVAGALVSILAGWVFPRGSISKRDRCR
jgi:ABC-type branched-subunit amino acid transport system permease subunit